MIKYPRVVIPVPCREISSIIERLSLTFTSNGKLEFVPRDEVSPLVVVYCSLFLHIH